jgi:hypothetical protein
MNDIKNIIKSQPNEPKPISPEVDTAMTNIAEAFMELRSTVNKAHYGKPTDIKGAVNRLLGCVAEMVEVVE